MQLLQSVKQQAEVRNIIFQLEIEQDYWAHVTDFAKPVLYWLSTAAQNVTRKNSIHWDYPRIEHNIRHRQEIIENKLYRARTDLNTLLQRQILHPSPENSIQVINQALASLIRNNLHRLHSKFEQKKAILQFDMNDVHLVQSFYGLNPTEEQVYISFVNILISTNIIFVCFQISYAQKIWKGKMKSNKRAISEAKTSPFRIDHTMTQPIFQGDLTTKVQ